MLPALPQPARARRARAGHRSAPVRDRAQRLRSRALLAAHGRPGRRVAPCPGRRPARLAPRPLLGLGQVPPRAGGGRRRRAGAALGEPLHRGQASRPARALLRSCARGAARERPIGLPGPGGASWSGRASNSRVSSTAPRTVGCQDRPGRDRPEGEDDPPLGLLEEEVRVAGVAEQAGLAGTAAGLAAGRDSRPACAAGSPTAVGRRPSRRSGSARKTRAATAVRGAEAAPGAVSAVYARQRDQQQDHVLIAGR